jgi:hypothetical protein
MENHKPTISPAEIEQLVHRLEAVADSSVRRCAEELVASVLELHAMALRRMLKKLGQMTPESSSVLAAFDGDELIRSVLLLHDLHPESIIQRVNQALEHLRPRMERYGAAAELIAADEEEINVRISASTSCGTNAEAIRLEIHNALVNAAPDAGKITVELHQAPSGFVPVNAIHVMSSGPCLSKQEVPQGDDYTSKEILPSYAEQSGAKKGSGARGRSRAAPDYVD